MEFFSLSAFLAVVIYQVVLKLKCECVCVYHGAAIQKKNSNLGRRPPWCPSSQMQTTPLVQ